MLDFLITSDARRKILALLFSDGASGTASSLARRAQVSTAAAYKELRAMHGLGLAKEKQDKGKRTYAAVADHPHTSTIQALLKLPLTGQAAASGRTKAPKKRAGDERNRVRNALAAHGAKLRGNMVSTKTDLSLEGALAAGCRLAHEDTAVARALPQLFYTHRNAIDYAELEDALLEAGEKHTAGFLIALAAKRTNTPALARRAQPLRDKRRKKPVDFFSPSAAPKPAKDDFTLPLAKNWHYHFPLPLADFKISKR